MHEWIVSDLVAHLPPGGSEMISSVLFTRITNGVSSSFSIELHGRGMYELCLKMLHKPVQLPIRAKSKEELIQCLQQSASAM